MGLANRYMASVVPILPYFHPWTILISLFYFLFVYTNDQNTEQKNKNIQISSIKILLVESYFSL